MAVSGQVSGVLEVPGDFKPSSLIGKPVRTKRDAGEWEGTIERAYTLRGSLRLFGGHRKRVKFVAN